MRQYPSDTELIQAPSLVSGVGVRFQAFGGMNSVLLGSISSEDARPVLDAVTREALRIQAKFSRYDANSAISRINRLAGEGPVPVDEETWGLLEFSAEAFRVSEGLFDITSGVLRRAWDFKRAVVPPKALLDALCERVGFDKLVLRDRTLKFSRPDMEIDFGGVGKEYAVDRTMSLLRAHGIRSALINFGGDIGALGNHPSDRPWRIGVRHPRHTSQIYSVLALSDACVATSGDYERFIIVSGVRYCHVLDPRSGMPAAGVASVTVRRSNCLDAGVYSTTAMCHGLPGAHAFLLEHDCEGLILAESEGAITSVSTHGAY